MHLLDSPQLSFDLSLSLFSSPLKSFQLVLSHLTSVPPVQFFLSPVEVTQLQTFLFSPVELPFHSIMVSTFDCVFSLVSCTIIQSYWTVDCYLRVQRSNVAGATWSANSHLQTTIRIARLCWRRNTIRAALAQLFHTAICADWIARRNRIATHYCRTHRFDAPVPMHKVSQRMQSTLAQHQQKRKKSPGTLSSTASPSKIPRQSGTPATVAQASQLFSAAEPPFTLNTQCFVQILTFKSHPLM